MIMDWAIRLPTGDNWFRVVWLPNNYHHTIDCSPLATDPAGSCFAAKGPLGSFENPHSTLVEKWDNR